jgi:hypothetical protein
MRRIAFAAALFVALIAVTPFTPASAQATQKPIGSGLETSVDPTSLGNLQIEISYVQPKQTAFQPIYERLRARRVLETLRAFLSPLNLPRKFSVKLDQCNALTVPYNPKTAAVTICYEYVALIERYAPDGAVFVGNGQLTRADALTGAFVELVLHESAHAVFDILQVPIWGREEDAADKVAALLMLNFGTDVAWKTLVGTAWFLSQVGATGIGTDFYYIRSIEGQRFFNFLCIAYGSDPTTFAFLVRNNNLPKDRAQGCVGAGGEYDKLLFAFNKAIMPYVDRKLMDQVRSINWLQSDKGK